jgi:hypothetical protein
MAISRFMAQIWTTAPASQDPEANGQRKANGKAVRFPSLADFDPFGQKEANDGKRPRQGRLGEVPGRPCAQRGSSPQARQTRSMPLPRPGAIDFKIEALIVAPGGSI